MKIVQLITKMDTLGGAQIHVRDLAIGMQTYGHSVVLVSGEGESIYNKSLNEKGVSHYQSTHLIREVSLISDIRAFFELRKMMKMIQPDLIAAHSSKAGVLGRLVGWSLRIPTVFTAHGWSFTEGIAKKKRIVYRVIEKVVGSLPGSVITVSEYDYQLAKKHNIISVKKLHRIQNGVHDCGELKELHNINEVPTILMVARFAVPKKQLQLVKALEKIQSSNWQLQLVGEGPLLEETMAYVVQQKLTHRIQFLGNRRDIPELLQQTDLFVLLSDWEGLPLSILEAMRTRLPIIATDVGGVSEAVKHGCNGFLLPKNDEDELVRKLTILLNDSVLRSEMGRESRRLFEENFTFFKMLTQTEDLYEKLLMLKGGQQNESTC